MVRLVSFVCIFSAFAAFGQSARTDSLLTLLSEKTNEQRVYLLHEIVKSLWTTDPQIAVKYGREAISLSKELGDLRLESVSYRIFGGLYNYMSLIDSGSYFKSQALKIALQLNDSLLLAPTYNNLGVTSQTKGNYVEALNYYYMSYIMGRDFPEFAGLPIVIANISEVYYDISEYDSAIRYARMSMQLTEDNPNTPRHLLGKIGLARANLAKGNLSEAESDYRSIIEIGLAINEKRYTAYAYQGLGRLNTEIGDQESARSWFSKSLELFWELDDQTYIAELFWDLSNLYLNTRPDSALYFAKRSQSIAYDLELNDIILANYENLIELFTKTGNLDSTRHYVTLHHEMEAFFRKDNNSRNIQGMFSKIQEEQIKRELAERSIQLERKTYQTNFSIALALIVLSFAAVVFMYYRRQKKLSFHLTTANELANNQNEMIDKKNKELETLNSEKNHLIGIVAHDLKSPLHNIINSARLMTDSSEDGSQSVLVDTIEASATRLSKMVSKILDIESIEKGLSNLESNPVNLSETIHSVCDEFKIQASDKKIKMHQDIDENVMISGDSTYLHQVFENLISNAIKFSPQKKNVFIVLKTHNNQARVEISDEGPGISEKEQAQLFQVYQKLSATPTGEESSTGLGLSIVKKFVDAMHGKIWCKSKEGEGTSFYAQFQLA